MVEKESRMEKIWGFVWAIFLVVVYFLLFVGAVSLLERIGS
jgi:hypothetical protein